ncbi:MAG: hypothetical protein GX542_06530 [Rhodococcus sp.]|nr:hypothetical protein [Rhodococcus sp. (in: high G+C Gram-positive bacteria)]
MTSAGGQVAIVGHPQFGLLAAVEMGAKLERIALIPHPGPDPIEIAAVLLDGMDLVVLGLSGTAVSLSRARAVQARARNKGATLLVTGGSWDGTEVWLDAQVGHYRGVVARGADRSIGRLCTYRLRASARGRSFQPRTTEFDVCWVNNQVEWVAASESADAARTDTALAPVQVVGL